MRLVERMTIAPMTCLYCGRGNTDEPDKSAAPFLDLERDVNWGDAVYLCQLCMDRIAEICGYVSREELREKKIVIREKNREIHELEAAMQERTRRARAVMAGRRAIKDEKADIRKEKMRT